MLFAYVEYAENGLTLGRGNGDNDLLYAHICNGVVELVLSADDFNSLDFPAVEGRVVVHESHDPHVHFGMSVDFFKKIGAGLSRAVDNHGIGIFVAE